VVRNTTCCFYNIALWLVQIVHCRRSYWPNPHHLWAFPLGAIHSQSSFTLAYALMARIRETSRTAVKVRVQRTCIQGKDDFQRIIVLLVCFIDSTLSYPMWLSDASHVTL
jgi:hypothetical protein